MIILVLISFLAYYMYYGSIAIFGEIIPDYAFWIGFAFISIGIFFVVLSVKKRLKMKIDDAVLVLLLFLIIVIFSLKAEMNSTMIIQRNLFILWSFPSALIGIAAKTWGVNLSSRIEWIAMYLFLALVVEFFAAISVGRPTFGGTTYQNYSYAAAFVYSLELYALFWMPADESGIHFSKNVRRTARYIMVFASMLFMAFGGGRGAIGTAIAVTFLTFLLKDHEQGSYKKTALFTLLLVLIVMGGIVISKIPMLASRFNRILQFFGNGSFDWKNASSGRDKIYLQVFELMKSEPILGYGLLNGIKMLGRYSHNLFFDMLLEGNVLYLLLWLLILGNIFINILLECKRHDKDYFGLYLFVLCLGRLMFSGMYWSDGGFWLLFGMFFNYRLKIKEDIREVMEW